jgi:hypothetical protein
MNFDHRGFSVGKPTKAKNEAVVQERLPFTRYEEFSQPTQPDEQITNDQKLINYVFTNYNRGLICLYSVSKVMREISQSSLIPTYTTNTWKHLKKRDF